MLAAVLDVAHSTRFPLAAASSGDLSSSCVFSARVVDTLPPVVSSGGSLTFCADGSAHIINVSALARSIVIKLRFAALLSTQRCGCCLWRLFDANFANLRCCFLLIFAGLHSNSTTTCFVGRCRLNCGITAYDQCLGKLDLVVSAVITDEVLEITPGQSRLRAAVRSCACCCSSRG